MSINLCNNFQPSLRTPSVCVLCLLLEIDTILWRQLDRLKFHSTGTDIEIVFQKTC